MDAISATMPLGVVLERRRIDNPWRDHIWRAVAVLPGAAPISAPIVLAEGPGWLRCHAATLALTLHRRDTDGYRRNLSQRQPMVYVVLRRHQGEVQPQLVTANPYEGEDYEVGGDEPVQAAPMPPALTAWVKEFVDRHHVDIPFEKRRRGRDKPESRHG